MIKWNFLRAVLKLFHPTWIACVTACVKSVSYFFRINESPHGHVTPLVEYDKVIHYHCTYSYFARRWSQRYAMMLRKKRSFRGSRCSGGVQLSITLCLQTIPCSSANQTLLGSQPLRTFSSNMELSRGNESVCPNLAITSTRTPPVAKLQVKFVLEIEVEGGIEKYLGLPELFGRKKRDIFGSILEQIKQKIYRWTTFFLFGAWKQVLLKAILAAIPNYAMSCFMLPASLCKQI